MTTGPVLAPAPGPAALARDAEEALALFERFGALASAACAALASGDDAAIERALDERQRLTGQIEPLVAKLVRDGRRADALRADALLAPVQHAAFSAAASGARLAEIVEARRAEIEQALDALRRGDAATSAYLGGALPGVHIDLTR